MNPALRTLIVDDEELARLRLRGLLQELAEPALEVIGEAADAASALALLQARPCELVLLDIRMPGRDGMQLAAALRSLPQPPSVVFVTAHGSHALRAFELEAVDYLTKPVRRERLQAALQRVVQRRWPAQGQGGARLEEPVLVAHTRGQLRRIPVAEVLVLKAEQKYVTLRTAAETHLLDDSLTDLEQRLGPGFIRIHRNALVAARAVRELRPHAEPGGEESWAVRVAPIDEWLLVSRRQLPAVREALGRR
ncbi:MAG: DNA-binding response regulator [Rubrivivax sp. SCN 71-131]|nr:MAG: DNA-binding response regulator [Rubrivivax sp. SCN 71-131]